ncbi:MAG: S-adenosylmethionine transporter [Caeruleum heppii]|nr:MAG: S-adenosylmethionine transporter [Caeruleum heppii]
MSSPPAPSPSASRSTRSIPYSTSLLAGALAGTTVDLSLYPLDTLKTRLQSPRGFLPSGGFQGIYKGVGSALVGSAPGAALFFVAYEGVKGYAGTFDQPTGALGRHWMNGPAVHMVAASVGEVAACAVRVPTEVVKQRAQASQHASSWLALKDILSRRKVIGLTGLWKELYRGWGVTILREVPFTVIQFPIWEALKAWRSEQKRSYATTGRKASSTDVTAVESALFGSLSGAVAAALTTPLDVLKTRMMLAQEKQPLLLLTRSIIFEEGPRTLFAGLGPRTLWISIGGAVFLGSYQWAVNTLEGWQSSSIDGI